MKKKIILIVIVILACSLVGYGFYKKEDVDQNKENNNISGDAILNEKNEEVENSIEIRGEKVLGNIKFTNIKFNYIAAEEYEFIANIENIGSKTLEATNVDINVFNSKGETISIFGAITTPLMPGEKGILKSYLLANVEDINDVEFSF